MKKLLMAAAAALAVALSAPAAQAGKDGVAITAKEYLEICSSQVDWHKLVCADYTVAVIDTFSAMALTALKSGDTTQRVEIGKICFRFNDKNLVSGERLQGYVLKMISRWGDNMGNMPAAGVMLAGMRSEYPWQ